MNALLAIRSSFRARVLLPVLAFLTLVPAVTLWIIEKRGTEKFERDTRSRLITAEATFDKAMEDRRRNLFLQFRDVTQDVGLKALAQKVQVSDDVAASKKTMQETLAGLRKRLSTTESEIEAITYASVLETGEIEPSFLEMVRRDNSDIQGSHLYNATQRLHKRAEGNEIAQDEVFVDGELLHVISAPVTPPNSATVGVLTIAVRLNENFARDLSTLTRSEVVFVANGQAAVSTLKPREIEPSLSAILASMRSMSETPVVINDNHYKALAGKLNGKSEAASGLHYVLLSSYEDSLRELRTTQLTLWAVSFAALLASAMGVWLTIGRATEPLRRLRNKVEAVGRGDFSKRIEVQRTDELGSLARAFNEMTDNLQTSRAELEKTLETLKTTQNQLIQREKLSAVGEFVAGVAHELNNPLTSLIGFAELLQAGGVTEKQQSHLNYIVKSSQRCHKIVQNLLSFARQHPPERNVVKLADLCDSVIELLAYEMRSDNIEVLTRYDSTLPPIIGDFHQLQQVVLNILNNARHALEDRHAKGQIRVVTERAGDFVRIVLSDNGPGISSENLAKIFDPFFTTKPVGKGTGLGLSLCYGIIKEHGGSIQASSVFGQGATFTIELPAATQAEGKSNSADQSGSEQSSESAAGKRILVIDDEDWILTLTRKILEEDGFHVDVANNGESALTAVAKTRYDLLVCDQKMPGLSGPQLYRKLLVSHPETAERLIFMTGDVVGDNFQQFLKETRKTCLTKPFSLKQLRSTVAEAIRK